MVLMEFHLLSLYQSTCKSISGLPSKGQCLLMFDLRSRYYGNFQQILIYLKYSIVARCRTLAKIASNC